MLVLLLKNTFDQFQSAAGFTSISELLVSIINLLSRGELSFSKFSDSVSFTTLLTIVISLISSVTLVGAIPFSLGFSTLVVLGFCEDLRSPPFFPSEVVRVVLVVVLVATVRLDKGLISVFFTVVVEVLLVAVP